MPHPKILLDQIAKLLNADYPPARFEYFREKVIPGTRYFPDLRIVDDRDRTVCVVEVGYTRPEKLTAYRDLGIADVRWYDKAGNIHARHTIVETREPPEGCVFSICEVYGEVYCPDCYDEELADPELEDPEVAPHESEDDIETAITREAEAEHYARKDVFTYVLSDGIVVLLPSFCDKCGLIWSADTQEEGAAFVADLDLRALERRAKRDRNLSHGLTWAAAMEQLSNFVGTIELDYYRADRLRYPRPD